MSSAAVLEAIDALVTAVGVSVAEAGVDAAQAVAYDLAATASAANALRALVGHAADHPESAGLAEVFAGEVASEALGRFAGRGDAFGIADQLAALNDAAADSRDAAAMAVVGDSVLAGLGAGPRGLPQDVAMVRDAFARFSDDKVLPIAERIHREDADIPEEIIQELAGMGCFALSIPAEHGGALEGNPDDLLNMVVVTEELSRGSLGAAGSLITRPEIMGTAVEAGGTDEQKARWLPAMAAGELLCAVAVTEPDFGSDVAALKFQATRDGDDWVLNGVKTWCTFAGRADALLVLARTDPDMSLGHKGLSLFVVPKDQAAGHAFEQTQDGGGTMEGRAIPTLGYRGMHSFEVAIKNWRVPHANLIGEDDGLGQGFYLQMKAFANARLQTAARANGIMQAALDESVSYAQARHVFGGPLADQQLTKIRIARQAARLAASRAYSYDVARALVAGDAALDASMLKQYSCLAAEWVARDAQQLHGGFGYAEEYRVSRLFVDARVLSIFEGADEVLALKVIARGLVREASPAD